MDYVVVAGLSARLPESNSPEEFWSQLVAGVDMVTAAPRNFSPSDFGVPERYGKLKGFDRFDSQFFEIHPKQAEKLDPQVRLLLEVAQEALLDAAVNPEEIAGTAAGVFVGACTSDAMANNVGALDAMTGYEATGCALSMFANRISYHFDLVGPSMTVDTACSSSLTAFDLACKAITSGECDYALVGGSNFILHPLWSVGFQRLNMLSPSGRCRSFQEGADGFARAEGVVVVLLTRESLARKKYARVIATGCNNDGFTREGITFPKGDSQKALLRRVYGRSGIDVNALRYVEAHGTGTAAGDPVELGALEGVLFDELGRERPLNVGSVKSNMGHAEGASGLAGMAKVLLSMLHGVVPPNLHTDRTNTAITGLRNGRLQLVDGPLPFPDGLAAVSSFGFGGSSAHVVLEKVPASAAPLAELYPLPLCARTKDDLARLEADLRARNEFGRASTLLTALYRAPARKYPARQLLVRGADGAEVARFETETTSPPGGAPVWLLLNGVGSHWCGMGRALRSLPVARATLERCARHLARHGLDATRLLTADDPALFEAPEHIFVGIAAIQLALLSCLDALGVRVDGFFGHSVGELVCAHLDGALSFEQTLDIAYYRGRALSETRFVRGAMAAVESELETLRAQLPDGVEIACYNGGSSYTIAGPAAEVAAFAARLAAAGHSARVVDAGGVPFHSSHLRGAEGPFRERLIPLLRKPAPRSSRWLSTSRDRADATRPDLADVDYFVDNLLKPVRLDRCLEQLPRGAVLLEIGPHRLFRSQCRAVAPEARHVSLMKRGEPGSGPFFEGIGELWALGVPIDWQGFLPGLASDNPLLRLPALASWDHRTSWPLPAVDAGRGASAKSDYVERHTIDIETPEHAFIKDHVVHGQPVFPGVGYLHLVWLTLAQWKRKKPEDVAIELRDVRFVRASIFRNTSTIVFTVKLDTLKNTFSVLEDDQLVADGSVTTAGHLPWHEREYDATSVGGAGYLEGRDIYKLFARTGIAYGPLFEGIAAISADRTRALVTWTQNLTTYFDALLQLLVLEMATQAIGLPRRIGTFRFDPARLPAVANGIAAILDPSSGSVFTPCVEISDVETDASHVPGTGEYVLQEVAYQPYEQYLAPSAQSTEYQAVCRAVMLDNVYRVLRHAELEGAGDVSHLMKIEAALGTSVRPHELPASVDAFREHPRAHLLRVVDHAFSDLGALVRDAMPLILSAPNYRALYREDLLFGGCGESLRNLLELVVRNVDGQALRVFEVGAGTGAMTSVALPFLAQFDATYEISDISAAFFRGLMSEFADSGAKIRQSVWDANTPMTNAAQYDLVLASNALHTVRNIETSLSHVARGLAEGGFLLLHETTDNFWCVVGLWGFIRDFWDIADERVCGLNLDRQGWIRAAERAGLTLVASRDGHVNSYLLFRKVSPARAEPASVLAVRDVTRRSVFDELRATLEETPRGRRVWLTGCVAESPGLDGLVRSLAAERPEVRGLLTLGAEPPPPEALADAQHRDLRSNVWKDGRLGTFVKTRWDQRPERNTPPVPRGAAQADQLRVTRPGDLDSIRRVPVWRDVEATPSVRVRYFALNFKDVMLASGRLAARVARPFGEPIGLEYAGELDDGTRVMGMSLVSDIGAAERLPLDNPYGHWPVPAGMSLEAACTIPIAYCTAYVGIVQQGRAQRGETIFIHSGAGAVGQAAIRIALNLGLTVFTTVSSASKVEFLLERFPSLGRDRIFDSRSTRFREEILTQTGGRGVDIVLNSFAGDPLRRSLEVVARYGRFVDISRYDVLGDGALPMRAFMKGATFTNVALDEMYRDGHPGLADLHRFIAEGLRSGDIVPLAYAVEHDVTQALARLLKGDTIGKLVLELDAARKSVPALRAFWCAPHKVSLVTGGLGGIGLELCEWLADRGARHLVVVSRSEELTAYQRLRIERLRARGVEVEVSGTDLSRAELADDFVRELERRRPVGGVFHLAMVLRDAHLADVSFDDFALPIRVKIGIGDCLDRATRKHCAQLEHFVMFSSGVSFFGNEGQTSYAYGNSALERLCERRRRKGLPGLAIQLGAVSDVGFVARTKLGHTLSHLGVGTMRVEGLLDALERALASDATVVSAYTPFRAQRAATEAVRRSLVDVVLEILGFDLRSEAISESKTLSELGIDSLMVVDISQVLSRDYGVNLAPRQIRELTLERVRQLGGQKQPPAPSQARVKARSIHEPHVEVEGPSVCYYVDGLFLDPERSPAIARAQQASTYFSVPYHDGIVNADRLAAAFVRHLEALSPTVVSVTIAGFSRGAALASVLGAAARKAGTTRSIVVKGFALPRQMYDVSRYEALIGLVNGAAGSVVAATASEAIAILVAREADPELQRRVVAFVKEHLVTPEEEGTPVSYRGLLNHLRFVHESKDCWLGALAFDELTVFSDDALSIDRATAELLAARVHEIHAPHNSARVVL